MNELSFHFRTRALSPLRYPGGKRRFAAYVATLLELNDLRPKLFVEPFAGGASVALQLLSEGLVGSIGIGEQDPLVASFWQVVFFDSEWLIGQIEQVQISTDMWHFFRENSDQFVTDRYRALACLFLNRTSFSGVLARTAGPIGGKTQSSQYAIDCRFPKATLIKRIKHAASLRDRVEFVVAADWQHTLAHAKVGRRPASDVFYYFDPPFYAKAERLYRHYFRDADHLRLRDAVAQLSSPWLLSYDVAEPIMQMYMANGATPRHVDILYSIKSSSALEPARELVLTNLKRVPAQCRLWKSATVHPKELDHEPLSS